jgi:hypothetical protein
MATQTRSHDRLRKGRRPPELDDMIDAQPIAPACNRFAPLRCRLVIDRMVRP